MIDREASQDLFDTPRDTQPPAAAPAESAPPAATLGAKLRAARAARGLDVVAWAPDGVVEAIEAPEGPFLLGIQSHPERLESTG